MPFVFPASGFGRSFQSTAKAGVTATAGSTAHTMGSWVTLIDPLSYDLFGIAIEARDVAASALDSRMLGNIGVSPTGGGSEQIVIPFLDWGSANNVVVSGTSLGVGQARFFPLYVPSGKAVRAQCQAVVLSDTVTLIAHFFSLPPHGFAEDAPQEWVQYGASSAASRGTAITSGNAAFGTEVQMTASTSRGHRWFHVGIDWGTNTGITAGTYRVRLARDTAAAEVIGIWDFQGGSGESISGPSPSIPACYPLPAGSTLYIDVDGAAVEAMSAVVYAA